MLVASTKDVASLHSDYAPENSRGAGVPLQSARYVPDWLARHRIKITVVVFLAMIATEVALHATPRQPFDWSDPCVAFGSLGILAGLLIRSWAAGTLVKKKKLAQDGPYSLVRHPLYLGSTLMMLGFTLLTGMWWNVAVAALTALVCFGHAIRTEEAFLSAKFTHRWQTYAAKSGRLLPRGLAGKLVAPWSLLRWSRNREYNAWAGTLCGWVALYCWAAFWG